MSNGYFITGTDTDCGKTVITLGLMQYLQQQGYSVLGMKPVASGALQTPDGLRNQDALQIQQQASTLVEYNRVNPFAYAPPIAPHLAAAQVGEVIDFDPIDKLQQELGQEADYVLVEGVGGWMVPLNEQQTVADLAVRLQFPVILVVGLKLGCINHALLSAQAIESRGLKLAGWVANMTDPEMLQAEANLNTLQQMINAPFMGQVPFLQHIKSQDVAAHLSL